MTTISYIFTRGGLSLVIAGKAFNIEQTHPNYQSVVTALKSKQYDDIPDLIDQQTAVKKYVEQNSAGDVTVDVHAGVVNYRGEEVHNSVTEHIIKMMHDGFSVEPLVRFLDNLMQNPSKKAIDELYRWMTANGITITEDGHILAYKRVQDDYTSFHDNKTLHAVGKSVSMNRYSVDDRSEVTCSTGLHFCSHAYLPNYCAGRGRVLVLKINPRDVVSIPNDYNDSKGRACEYFVMEELVDNAREVVEEKPVITQSVVTAATNLNKSETYRVGYAQGYKDGRGKKKRQVLAANVFDDDNDGAGYCDGYKDGREKNPKLY